MDGSGGTFGYALTAGLAEVEVDVGKVVLHRDGTEGAGLGTLATANTGSAAGLAGGAALLLVAAGHINTAVFQALLA